MRAVCDRGSGGATVATTESSELVVERVGAGQEREEG